MPAAWVDRHVDRTGGWRLAPQLLVDQLRELDAPAPLVMIPRRPPKRLNSQFDVLGEAAEILLHPDDAAAVGVADGQAVVVAVGPVSSSAWLTAASLAACVGWLGAVCTP